MSFSAHDPVIKVSHDVLLGFTFGIRVGLDVECGTGLLVTVRTLVEEPISALFV